MTHQTRIEDRVRTLVLSQDDNHTMRGPFGYAEIKRRAGNAVARRISVQATGVVEFLIRSSLRESLGCETQCRLRLAGYECDITPRKRKKETRRRSIVRTHPSANGAEGWGALKHS